MEDLLNVTKMIEIKDILTAFMFGFEDEYPISINDFEFEDVLINVGNYQGDEEILDWMKYFWKPSLHFERGICYTFDDVAIILNQTGNDIIATESREAMSKSRYKGTMLSLHLTFNVSFGKFHCICNFNSSLIIENF